MVWVKRDRRQNGGFKVGVVAMWFDQELNKIYYDHIITAINDTGYKPIRIDGKEHINKICDEIIAEIRKSRFIIADFTGQRGGVYYEARFAHGLGIPIIWTCRKDGIDKLHFDIRQYNCILWEWIFRRNACSVSSVFRAALEPKYPMGNR